MLPRTLCTATVGCLSLLAIGATHAWSAEGRNPCALLTAAEVEEVLGEPLAGPPFRAEGFEPSISGATCRYETAGFRAVTIEVDWTDGGMVFGMMNMVSGIVEAGGVKGQVTFSDGTEMTGAWDRAGMFMCCQFNALRGDRRVMVDISATKLTEQAAGALADKAVRRLDQPLDVADDLGHDAAMLRNEGRPKIVPACDLVSRSEAEAILGAALAADPEGDESSCAYVWTPPGADYQEQLRLMVTWRGGFAEMRMTEAAIGAGLGALGVQGLELSPEAKVADRLFDAYSTSIIGVMGVRKDVLLRIESGPITDPATRLIATAAGKL